MVKVEIPWATAFRSGLVFRDVGIHGWSEEARILRHASESADGLACSDRFLVGCLRELESAVMCDKEHAASILWNAEICSVEKLMLDHIAHLSQGGRSLVKIGPTRPDEQTRDILDQCEFGFAPFDGCKKCREAISLILIGLSLSPDAEGLAGRASYDDGRGREQEIGRNASHLAGTSEVGVISSGVSLAQLVANRLETGCLKAESQATATCEKVKDDRSPVGRRLKRLFGLPDPGQLSFAFRSGRLL
jgi:hypothetical protein